MTQSRADGDVRNQQWLLALLPTFPLVLLVLRLWYLSRQDLPTMLLLVQYVNPLGMISALVITLIWVLPMIILAGRFLGALLLLSVENGTDATMSWLGRAALRIPGWVVLLALLLAGLTWQMRFLPCLVMLAVSIAGLTVRARYGGRVHLVRVACIGVPLATAIVAYIWLAPAIMDAFGHLDFLTGALLLLPPGLAPLLTGPVPARSARLVTHWPATAAVLLTPVMMGAIFLRAPVLPATALEIATDDRSQTPLQVVRGHIITVDDSMTTLLDDTGIVRFIATKQVQSKTLCPEFESPPSTTVRVHDWPVEQTMLEWLAPTRRPTAADPRCYGRPLNIPVP
ncbi:MAG TPA: hypothetical protein VFM55_22390 [Micromonosporaceae bacterium]|nr:hypothetical protein [Micromonosporaceae bacterium]